MHLGEVGSTIYGKLHWQIATIARLNQRDSYIKTQHWMNCLPRPVSHGQPRLENFRKQDGRGGTILDGSAIAKWWSLQERYHQVFAWTCFVWGIRNLFFVVCVFHPVSNQVCRRGSVFFFLRSETITHWSTSQREGVFDLCLVGVLIDVHCTFGMALEMLALFYRKVSFYEILTESRKVIPFGLKPYLTPFIHVHKTACEIACRNEY